MSSIVWVVTTKIQMESKFYRVTCKCGHVGKNHFIRIAFSINVDSGEEASEIARRIPRVKHDHKDAILDCREIDLEEYKILQMINNNDPYLQCSNKQGQEKIALFSLRIEDEPMPVRTKHDRKERVEFKLRKARALNKYEMGYLAESLREVAYGAFAY